MFRKSLATALLVCAIPGMALASWQLTTQVRSAGGTLTSPNGTQGVLDQTLTTTQTSLAPLNSTSIFATADSASTANPLSILDSYVNGVGTLVTTPITLPFTPVDDHSYTVNASFSVQKLSVSAGYASGSYGTVTPASLGNIYNGYKLVTPVTFTFAPKAGYTISNVANVPAGATLTLPSAANQRATVVFPVGYTFTAPVSLVATDVNTTPTVNPIAAQNVVAGTAATVSVTGMNLGASPTYVWKYVSGPGNTSSAVTTNGKVSVVVTPGPSVGAMNTSVAGLMTFTAPTTPGQYKFTVTVNGTLTKLAVVNVMATAADTSKQCQFCHTANNIGDPNISATWAGSLHSQGGITCAKCHIGADSGGHPGPQVSSSNCQGCHTTTINDHTAGNIGSKVCLDCHDGHNPMVGTKPFLVAAGSHPAVTLYTFEEIGMQMNGGQKVPVQVDASGKGMPYSPKQTCGTAGCHVKNGADYTYDKISDTAFHSHEGRSEMMDVNNGNLLPGLHIPWVQSTAMVGKW